jgi:hypothetical protein
MASSFVCGAFVGFGMCLCLVRVARWCARGARARAAACVDAARDALLAYALVRIRSEYIDDFNVQYATFDGSRLPMFTGSTLSKACMSYLSDSCPTQRKFGVHKTRAARRFLHTHLGTMRQAHGFVEEFIDAMESGPSNVFMDKKNG